MERVIESLRRVRVPTPETRVEDYPHQFSGGMRQRVVGAIAIACQPKLLIADEATTALDATIQAQYLDLLRGLQRGTRSRASVHHARFRNRCADVRRCRRHVCGPHRRAGRRARDLQSAGASLHDGFARGRRRRSTVASTRLYAIPGTPSSGYDDAPGCPFAPRCTFAQSALPCRKAAARPRSTPDHTAECWRASRSLWREHSRNRSDGRPLRRASEGAMSHELGAKPCQHRYSRPRERANAAGR